ncbi:MAG: ABC transporter ATP-binding protein [Candidatus Eisenbacteria bacterium]|nr:ABC transporter ATP-binding protein [Candidatus Eisenbacteria bacterium]
MDHATLEAEDLWKSFDSPGGELEVLKGIRFAPEPGCVTAVMGASGAGKSTLLHVMGTLDRPTRGRVLFSGEDIFRWDDNRLARFRNRSIGFIFQFHHLMPEFSALENVMMPGLIARRPKEDVSREARALLGRVGLLERLEHRPGQLSGGEQQRVAVARALINRPVLVLADEPSGNLDKIASGSLQDLIFALARDQGETFVIVTHDERLAARSDRVMVLDDGHLSEATKALT